VRARAARRGASALLALAALLHPAAAGASAGEPDPAPLPGGEEAPPPEHRTLIRRGPSVDHWSRPSAIIDRGAMGDAGADLPEVLDAQPGLRVTRLGGLGSFSLLSIRGSTAEQVQVTLDGVPLNTADGAPVDLATLPLGPIGAVALYRGLSPVIAGSSALGGHVAIQSREPRGHRLELEVGGGSFGARAARAFYSHGASTWGLAAAVDYQGSTGDFSYLHDGGTAWDPSDDRRVRRENNAFDQGSVLLKGRLRLGPSVRLTVVELASHTRRGLPGIGLYETRESHLTLWRSVLGARLEADLPDVQLAVTTYLAWARTELDDPLGEIGLGAARTRDTSWVPGVTAAMRWAAIAGEELALTALASASWRLERLEPERAGGASAGAPSVERHIASVAAELELEERATRTTLVLSGRWEAAARGQGGDGGGGSLRAAIVQRAIPDTRISLQASRGLRLPSLFELHGDTGYVLGNPGLRPEVAHGLELAIAHDALGVGGRGLLTVELAAFAHWVDDLVQYVQNAQQVARPDNVARARITGLEAGLFADLLGHLRLRGSATWMDAIDTSDVAARRGRQLPLRPRWQVGFRVEGYLDLGGAVISQLGIRADVDHLAGNSVDRANLVRLPARTLIGAGLWAHFARGALRLDLALRNLGGDQVQDLMGFPLPGTSMMASLTWIPPMPRGGTP